MHIPDFLRLRYLLISAALIAGLGIPQAEAQTPSETILRPSEGKSGDFFGRSLSLSGDRAIIGARRTDFFGTTDAGAAYIYEQDANGNWQEITQLRASNGGAEDSFGYDVAVSGDYAIVGAHLEDGPSDLTPGVGAAYVFERQSDGTWKEVELLRGSNSEESDSFGRSVAISGERAVVGAVSDEDPSTSSSDTGAAYIFERQSDGSWMEVSILYASNAGQRDQFGHDVSLSQNQIIVGAMTDDGERDNLGNSGAAYVFERKSDGTWQETALVRHPNPDQGDEFGWSVALEDGKALVGAIREDGPSDGTFDAGAAFIFEEQSDGRWTNTDVVRASNPGSSDRFGYSVAISSEQAVIGAHREDGPSDGRSNSGAAYLFERQSDGTWKEVTVLYASNADSDDSFGRASAISGSNGLFGAPGEDGPSNNDDRIGAVYAKTGDPLPVELAYIEAERSAQTVNLMWETASETGNAGFEVQHRAPQLDRFHTLDFVNGAGTTSEPRSYRYKVENLTTGTHRFRLRQVDTDGSTSLSEEVTAVISPDENLSVETYPSPASNTAIIRVATNQAQELNVELYDLLGRRVRNLYTGEVTPQDPKSISFQSHELGSGTYILRIKGETDSETSRLTIVQ
jgi:ketosteroid isomerase-like protein